MFHELIVGWLMAVGFCILAAIPLSIALVLSLLGSDVGGAASVRPFEWLLAMAAVFASYFIAATLAAPVCTLCRPFRDSLVGSMLTGALMAPIIYGSIGLVAILAWEPVGRIMFGDHGESQADFVRGMPSFLGVVALVGVVGGPFIRRVWRHNAV